MNEIFDIDNEDRIHAHFFKGLLSTMEIDKDQLKILSRFVKMLRRSKKQKTAIVIFEIPKMDDGQHADGTIVTKIEKMLQGHFKAPTTNEDANTANPSPEQ